MKIFGVEITRANSVPLTTDDKIDQVTNTMAELTGNSDHTTMRGRINAAVSGGYDFADTLHDVYIDFGADPWWWNGKHFEGVKKHEMNSKIAHAFGDSEYGKTSNIDGTDKQLRNLVVNEPSLAPSSKLVFFKNGVLDLIDGVMLPHTICNKNTATLSVDYIPSAPPPPEWNKFLHSIFDVEPERVTLLQEIMGWCMISDNLNIQKAIAFDGASRAGKGIIIDIISKILGKSAVGVSLEQLAVDKVLSRLRTTSIAIDSDAKTPDRTVIRTVHSNFNKMTANEPVSIPLLYTQEPWEGELNCKILIACNGMPLLIDDSGAAPGRWVMLKFTKSFLGREDLTLGRRLSLEIPSIAAWAVTGLRRLMANGKFSLPLSSIEESGFLNESSSPLLQFGGDRLTFGSDQRCSSALLFESYKRWCSETLNKPMTRNNFITSLGKTYMDKGVERKKSMRIGPVVVNGFTGLALADCVEGVTNINEARVK